MKSLAEYFFLKDFKDSNTQNLLKYSEDLDQSVWNVSAGFKRLSSTSLPNPFNFIGTFSTLSRPVGEADIATYTYTFSSEQSKVFLTFNTGAPRNPLNPGNPPVDAIPNAIEIICNNKIIASTNGWRGGTNFINDPRYQPYSGGYYGTIQGIKPEGQTSVTVSVSGSSGVLYDIYTGRVFALSGTPSIFQDSEFITSIDSENQYTFSFYVHQDSSALLITPSITFIDESDNRKTISAVFNTKNGRMVGPTTGNSDLDFYGSTNIGNGWFRYHITASQKNKTKIKVRTEILFNSPTPLASPWPNTIFLWGCQLEKGKPSTNYIKTDATEKNSILQYNFLNEKYVEPSFGIPYTENLLTFSQDYSAWNIRSMSLSANTLETLSPIGKNDSYKLSPNTQNVLHRISRPITLPQRNIPYTFSTFFKAINAPLEWRYAALLLSTPEDNNRSGLRVIADVQNGTIASVSGHNVFLSAASIEPYPNGWYKFNITGLYQNYGSILCEIYVGQFTSTNLIFAGNNIKGLYTWGSQLEKGTYVSNYVRTGSTSNTGPTFGSPVYSSTNSISTYYFPLNAKTEKHSNARRFTGNDTLTISKNNLAYNTTNPTFNFDISGSFRTLSAYIETLSTNRLVGDVLYFNDFKFINFDMKIKDSRFIFNSLTANKVFVTSLCSVSSVYVYIPASQDRAKEIFSSITWDVTAGGTVSAYNIFVKDKTITPFVSASRAMVYSLSATDLTVNFNLSSNLIFTEKINSFVDIDERSFLYYKDTSLSTRLSSVYYFGVKPSDTFSTDNIGIVRSLSGSWNGSNGSIIETLPVLKPYFKNVKQVFDYVERYGLYGENLNILIYEDIIQTNFNNNNTLSESGCQVKGNLKARYYNTNSLPVFLRNANFKSGDYIWADNNNAEVSGKVSYWNVDRLNFNNLNIVGMYEIGSLKNAGGTLEYISEKPFNASPRKITFRAYVTNNRLLNAGNFGGDLSAWSTLYTRPSADTFFRPIHFNGDEMDVNIKNICFEFDSNANDATCLYFKTGESYLSNVTVAALGVANYAYGAVLAWPKSTVYIRGTEQIDPHLLSPSRWNQWTTVPGAKTQTYYPGYGLAIVGNPTNENRPTLFSNSFIQAWKSKVFIIDYDTNRRIGKDCQLNASVILNGNFSSRSFFGLKDQAKVQVNNFLFRTNTFRLSNYQANIYNKTPNSGGQYINVFENFNRDNFYYIFFDENNSTFEPKYFNVLTWSFDDSLEPVILSVNNGNNFTAHFTAPTQNPKYIFEPSTRTINLTEFVFGAYQKNSLQDSPLNSVSRLFDYIDPNDLTLFNTNGLYNLNSPINPAFSYNLTFY